MLPQRLAHRLLHTAHGIVIPSKLAPGQVRMTVPSRANADTPLKFDRNGNPEDLKWNDPLRIISRGLLTTHREVGRNIYIYKTWGREFEVNSTDYPLRGNQSGLVATPPLPASGVIPPSAHAASVMPLLQGNQPGLVATYPLSASSALPQPKPKKSRRTRPRSQSQLSPAAPRPHRSPKKWGKRNEKTQAKYDRLDTVNGVVTPSKLAPGSRGGLSCQSHAEDC